MPLYQRMKSVQSTLLERRSIRRYEREAIAEKDMALIFDAVRNTPTSYNGQQFSVIDVTDQALKECSGNNGIFYFLLRRNGREFCILPPCTC